jgi:RES domain
MSSTIWTPDELSSSARPCEGKAWRVVEAQHRVSTTKLTDSLDEQDRLEKLIEATKPPIPPECRHLNFLLSTPFRYGSRYPTGSRFRRAGYTLGVFYASERAKTAIIEIAFSRLLFFADSPATPWPRNPGEFSAFAIEFSTDRALYLTAPPFDSHRQDWRHPTDYSACQALAEGARTAQVEVIKYESARVDANAANLALLTCRVFTKADAVDRRSWRIHFSRSGVRLFCEIPREQFDLPAATFGDDPRTAGMNWQR